MRTAPESPQYSGRGRCLERVAVPAATRPGACLCIGTTTAIIISFSVWLPAFPSHCRVRRARFFFGGEREALSMDGRAGPGPELATGFLSGDVLDLSTNVCQHVSGHSPACCIRCGRSGRVAQGSQVSSPHGRTVSFRLVHRAAGLAVSLCGLSPVALNIGRARLPPAPGVLRSSGLHHGRGCAGGLVFAAPSAAARRGRRACRRPQRSLCVQRRRGRSPSGQGILPECRRTRPAHLGVVSACLPTAELTMAARNAAAR